MSEAMTIKKKLVRCDCECVDKFVDVDESVCPDCGVEYYTATCCQEECEAEAVVLTEPSNMSFCERCLDAFGIGQFYPKETVIRQGKEEA